jgi:putative peptide zinc metalloprotease protein
MVMRIPMGDLAPVLRVAGGILALPYTRAGALCVVAILFLAAILWAGRGDVLAAQLARMADPGLADLATWYVLFILSKALHECGHAIAAQRMAAAEAHRIESFPFGLTLVFLLPAPYVDVSGTWFIADRRRRAAVGLAGIWMDLLIAGTAACVAALLAEGALRDRLCELVAIAGIASLLFNGNPLVRLDGYYVLSDLLEIPNLQARATLALKRHLSRLFGAGRLRSGDTPMAAYGLASLLYRFVIFAGIFFLAGLYHWTLAAAVAGIVLVFYVLLPTISGTKALWRLGQGRPLHTLAGSTAIAGVAAAFLLVPVPYTLVASGVAWNDSVAFVYARTDGQVVTVAAPETPGPAPLLEVRNPETERLRQQLALERESLAIEARRARALAPERIDAVAERARAVADQDAALAEEMAQYPILAPAGTQWQPLRAERLEGGWVRRDDPRPLGVLVGEGPTVIRIVLSQGDGPAALSALAARPDLPLPVRRWGEAEPLLSARPGAGRPDARDELPSPALALPNGGPFAVRADDGGNGLRTVERVFEVRLEPVDPAAAAGLLHGTRVEVLINRTPAPLAMQAWETARKLLQQRLGT